MLIVSFDHFTRIHFIVIRIFWQMSQKTIYLYYTYNLRIIVSIWFYRSLIAPTPSNCLIRWHFSWKHIFGNFGRTTPSRIFYPHFSPTIMLEILRHVTLQYNMYILVSDAQFFFSNLNPVLVDKSSVRIYTASAQYYLLLVFRSFGNRFMFNNNVRGQVCVCTANISI